MPLGMSHKFKRYIYGQKRTGCQEKKDLGLEIEEGKTSLSFDGLQLIAKIMFFSGTTEHMFSHLFLMLEWC